MANAYMGYGEPASPNRKLASDRRTRGSDSVDLQQILLFDATAENGAAVDSSGRLSVNTELPDAAALADSAANPTAPTVGSAGLLVHAASLTWDRMRSNSGVSVLTSGARTTTQTGSDLTNINWRGLHVIVNVTSAGTGSITPVIQAKDVANSVYYDLHAAATAITANGTYVYQVYPGAGAAAGGITQSTSNVVPRIFRVNVTHNNANTITYSVRVEGIV